MRSRTHKAAEPISLFSRTCLKACSECRPRPCRNCRRESSSRDLARLQAGCCHLQRLARPQPDEAMAKVGSCVEPVHSVKPGGGSWVSWLPGGSSLAGEGQRPPGACDLWFCVSHPVSGAWNHFLTACGLFPTVFSVPTGLQ